MTDQDVNRERLISRQAIAVLLLLGSMGWLIGSCSDGEHPTVLENIQPKDEIPPSLLFYSPAEGDTWVEIKEPIQLRFTEDIDPASVTESTFVIEPSVSSPRYVCRTQAACTTVTSLEWSTHYTVTLTTGITDTSGNRLDSMYSWSFLTRDPPPPPVITGISQPGAPINTPVMVLGEGFDTLYWNNRVWFNGDSAYVLGSSDTTIDVIVPLTATTGPIVVRNVRTTDTSDFDFAVYPAPDTLLNAYIGTYYNIQNYLTDSADERSVHVEFQWIYSSHDVFRMYRDRVLSPYPIFCDVGGEFEFRTGGIELSTELYNMTLDHYCDSTLHPGGFYGIAVVNDTLYMSHFVPYLRQYKYLVLTPKP
jgi:hypothetical protein